MRCYINDLSIDAQFGTPIAFIEALKDLLAVRIVSGLPLLFVSRDIFYDRPVCANATVSRVLFDCADRDFKRSALAWLSKDGPFLEDDKLEVPGRFLFENYDVTDQGLGEAARRCQANDDSATFSFGGGSIDFQIAELNVLHDLSNDESVVSNYWEPAALRAEALQAAPPLMSWEALLAYCRRRFTNLMFGENIEDVLRPHPFSVVVRDRTLILLRVLNDLMEHRDAGGALDATAEELRKQWFEGGEAPFSRESDRNEARFATKMTFEDPADKSKSLTCFYHGKIQTPAFRIHFEWPVPKGQDVLKVVYIGPKLSKR
jgi:hypothetical protein